MIPHSAPNPQIYREQWWIQLWSYTLIQTCKYTGNSGECNYDPTPCSSPANIQGTVVNAIMIPHHAPNLQIYREQLWIQLWSHTLLLTHKYRENSGEYNYDPTPCSKPANIQRTVVNTTMISHPVPKLQIYRELWWIQLWSNTLLQTWRYTENSGEYDYDPTPCSKPANIHRIVVNTTLIPYPSQNLQIFRKEALSLVHAPERNSIVNYNRKFCTAMLEWIPVLAPWVWQNLGECCHFNTKSPCLELNAG